MSTFDKRALLDSVAEEEGEIIPDLNQMKTMIGGDITMVVFCRKCGSYHGLKYKEAEELLVALGQPLEGFDEKYFIFSSCAICGGHDDTIELKSF